MLLLLLKLLLLFIKLITLNLLIIVINNLLLLLLKILYWQWVLCSKLLKLGIWERSKLHLLLLFFLLFLRPCKKKYLLIRSEFMKIHLRNLLSTLAFIPYREFKTFSHSMGLYHSRLNEARIRDRRHRPCLIYCIIVHFNIYK